MNGIQIAGLVFAVCSAIWVGIDAGSLKSKGVRIAPWTWVVGVLFFSIFVLIPYLVFRSGYYREADAKLKKNRERKLLGQRPAVRGNIRCPQCDEEISPKAKICKHCRTVFPQTD